MPLAPWLKEHWSILSPREQAVHTVLQSWFDAMQDGTAVHRLPDPGYQRPPEKEPWTEADLERLVTEIDTYVEQQMGWANGVDYAREGGANFDAGPGYARLAPAQRLAFAQDLERVVQAFPPPAPPPAQEFYAD